MGRCFRALFGIPLGPGALPTLRPMMASRTSSGLVNFGSRHFNRLNDGRDRRKGDRLKLSFQTVGEGFSFLRVCQSVSPRGDQGGDGVGTLITRLVIYHSDWSSGFRVSSVALHWYFLQTLSRLVTDL